MPRSAMSYIPDKGYWAKKIKGPDGSYVRIYGKTQAEVRRKIAERQAEWAAAAAPEQEDPTCGEYLLRYVQLTTGDISAASAKRKYAILELHILPVLAAVKVRGLTQEHALLLRASMDGLSHDLQQKTLAILRGACDMAVSAGLLRVNPCGGVTAKGKPAEVIDPLTLAQEAALVAAVTGTRAETFVRLGLYAGLRREEIMALQWDCVELEGDAPHLSVRRAARWPNNTQAEISEVLKSDAARRDIPLPASLVAHLEAVKAASTSPFVVPDSRGQAASYASLKSLWGIVRARTVRHGANGEPLRVGDAVPRSQGVVISLDFDCHPHQLRHTYITRLLLGGVDPKTVQYLAGHASARITLDIYARLLENRPRDIIHKVQKVFD